MENIININEYVRLDDGTIGIVKYIDTQNIGIITNNNEIEVSSGVVSHSSNIIDLVEENDAIKFWYEKERICNVYKTSNGNLCVWNGFEDVPIKHIQIKSIVTKEQFENIEYRLED